jgi:hypothetical protein
MKDPCICGSWDHRRHPTETPENQRAPMENGTVILKRTFNQPMAVELVVQLDPLQYDRHWERQERPAVRYWRVIGPANHPNCNSDLSVEGLREAGVI